MLLCQAKGRLGLATSLSCPIALSFAMWERHALQPAAMTRFGELVVALQHLGSYACRNVERRRPQSPRHGTADALDIAGFTLQSGKRVTLLF